VAGAATAAAVSISIVLVINQVNPWQIGIKLLQ
jgi:hypothetical protein